MKIDLKLLRAYYFELIAVDYPGDEWLHIYTDGSATGNATEAGLYREGFFEESYPAALNAPNFEAEIEAIKRALLNLNLSTPLKKVAFFIDSQSAILATVNIISDSYQGMKLRCLLIKQFLLAGKLFFTGFLVTATF
ncbi:hypothetical protein CEXT_608091 [Caerostris extrusa]|uniref:RNase H type-1 domain-containing protein n=1 Tax=Caerostris extrusa TaxID=172846 RepID=A0AAV4Q3J5_CAEEX|nr:hypothetical protein CEXT_608091 [Caerostris extrusa]